MIFKFAHWSLVASRAQPAAGLLFRSWARSFFDRRGAKLGVVVGLSAATATGLLYLMSLAFLKVPTLSVVVLLVGCAVLGGGREFHYY
jgi:hypothetical protein